MASTQNLIVSIKVDASQAFAEIDRLKEHLESVPSFEVQELEELTWSWPWWMLFAASVGGGLTVLGFFWIVATVFA